jgi:hypothetical protein
VVGAVQIGALIGKGGTIINAMREEVSPIETPILNPFETLTEPFWNLDWTPWWIVLQTGAHIRVLPREALPASAHDSDELVQVQGEITVVRCGPSKRARWVALRARWVTLRARWVS